MALEPFDTVRSALDAQWPTLGRAGDWWTGAERVAIAAEARAAAGCALCSERKAALSPYAIEATHPAASGLPAVAVDAAHRVASDPGRLSSHWFESCRGEGLEAAAIVELGGVVAIVTIADTLARALGQPRPALPEPVAGEPGRALPAGLEQRGAWAPMVAPERAEGMIRGLYENVESRAGFVFNVVRALSSAPSVWGTFWQVFLPIYATSGPMPEGGLTRPQAELLASTTSAWNDCFY